MDKEYNGERKSINSFKPKNINTKERDLHGFDLLKTSIEDQKKDIKCYVCQGDHYANKCPSSKTQNVSKTHLIVLEITEDDKRPHIILE